LSRRVAGLPPDGPFEGVPEYLVAPLSNWVVSATEVSGKGLLVAVGLALRVRWGSQYSVEGLAATDFLTQVMPQLGAEGLLDVADAVLHVAGGGTTFTRSGVAVESYLEQLLSIGGSARRVADSGSALERRVSDSARRAFLEAVAEAREASSAAHLVEAWGAAFGRNPDASKAYSEAVKAVEAAAIPVVTPKDNVATLGKIIGELSHNPQAYTFAIAGDFARAREVLRLLWEGQTDRHGAASPRPVSVAAAQAALQLSVCAVEWFQRGAIGRVP
jgi:hypothetical protein